MLLNLKRTNTNTHKETITNLLETYFTVSKIISDEEQQNAHLKGVLRCRWTNQSSTTKSTLPPFSWKQMRIIVVYIRSEYLTDKYFTYQTNLQAMLYST